MSRAQFVEILKQRGFVVGKRDPRLNRAFKGRFMVAEPYKRGIATDDARHGPWCIVGDNLAALITTACQYWDLDD